MLHQTFPHMDLPLRGLLLTLLLMTVAGRSWAYETLALRQLPAPLVGMWNTNKPQMNENSRCAAAFDDHFDLNKMIMRCSIYMRMGAEAERRAISYCEQDRKHKSIATPCRIVVE